MSEPNKILVSLQSATATKSTQTMCTMYLNFTLMALNLVVLEHFVESKEFHRSWNANTCTLAALVFGKFFGGLWLLFYWMESIGRSMSTPVLKTGRALFIQIRHLKILLEKIQKERCQSCCTLIIICLDLSNSSIKRKRGWIWTVLYHFLVWWHWHITAHIQTFRFHQTNQIHYIRHDHWSFWTWTF